MRSVSQLKLSKVFYKVNLTFRQREVIEFIRMPEIAQL